MARIVLDEARSDRKIRAIGAVVLPLVLVSLFASVACPRACCGVGVVLNESLDESMDRITGTGHTAIYFSNICPDSPVRLRFCRPGELGSVMSTYINISCATDPQLVFWAPHGKGRLAD